MTITTVLFILIFVGLLSWRSLKTQVKAHAELKKGEYEKACQMFQSAGNSYMMRWCKEKIKEESKKKGEEPEK